MKKLKAIAVLSAFSFLLASCTAADKASDIDTSDKTASVIEKMTDEEKVAQLFMVRCDSENPEYMLLRQPGGIVMFSVDFENLSEKEVKDKIKNFKKSCNIEPIIAVDEEGGTVVRVSSHTQLYNEKFKSPGEYFSEGGLELVLEKEGEKSDLLRSLGITMNLAPVADVSQNPSDFIYDRSLGQDAALTSEFTASAVNIMHEHNIMSCLKHFPGYGSNVDTHTGIAVDNRSIDEFRQNDFLPFKSGISAGTDAVLVAHNIITNIDSSCPASISAPVHDILRNELKFNGIIMTDDMSMQAMAEYEQPYKKAVLAGNDMIIVSDFDTAYNEVLDAVRSGEIPKDTLNNAVKNILRAKEL